MRTVWTARKPLFLDSPQTNGRTRVGIRHWMPWGSWDERSLKCRRATKLKILERFQHQPLVPRPTKSEEARFDLCHFSLYGRSRWHSRCLGIGRMGAPRRGRWTRVVVGRLDATTPAVMRQSRRVWRMESSEENCLKGRCGRCHINSRNVQINSSAQRSHGQAGGMLSIHHPTLLGNEQP